MKNYLLIGIIIALFVGVIFFAKQRAVSPENSENPIDSKQYTSSVYGLSFLYPTTYVLSEVDAPGSEMRKHHTITLTHKDDLPLPEAGEYPPSITIDTYQNDLDNQTTGEWIRNSSVSNFKMSEGVLASTTISGLPALSYRWSGLYEGTTIALARPNWIYVFTVTYLEMGASIVQDFVAIRDSVKISNP